ncbi:MAG: hypothetical protein J5J06_07005 [Phycisphaerae bacterium]|nr:hypothetical protein [Phycisphaerae bacterium]
MGETLDALHRLQVVELELAALRRDRESRVRRVEVQQKALRQLDDKMEQQQRLIRQAQIRLDALNLDLESRESTIQHHREALNKAKTNKEYAAILAAKNTEQADKTKVENTVLQAMEEVQNLKTQLEALQEEKETRLNSLRQAEQALAHHDEKDRPKREELMAQRDEFSAEITPTTLQTFIRVAEHLEGEAMAAVRKLHPKKEDYLCSGCNISVTLEVVNALQTRDEIQLCKSCGRILFLESATSRA